MKKFMFILLVVTLVIGTTIPVAIAQDPYGEDMPDIGSPEDNLCNEDGSMEGKCATV